MNIPVWILVLLGTVFVASVAFVLGRRVSEGDPKAWWRSKVLWVNAAAFTLTALEANFGTLRTHFGPESYLAASILLAGANFILRSITTQPIK